MLGKVMSWCKCTSFYTFNLGETIKVVDGPLMVSMVLLKKLMKRSVN
jgi:hypothetical protein